MIKKISVVALALSMALALAPIGANAVNAKDNVKINRNGKKGQTREILPKKGQVLINVMNDVYYNYSDASMITKESFLAKLNLDIMYSLKGDEEETIVEDLVKNADRLKISESDLNKIRNAKSPGMIPVVLTYTNKEIADLGIPGNNGVFNETLNINIVDEGVTSYDSDLTSVVAALHVHNFEVKLNDAKSFTESKAKTNAESQFKAWDTAIVPVSDPTEGQLLNPGKDLGSSVKVNSSQVNAIKNAKKAGAYPLEYTLKYYMGGEVKRTATVFVSNANTKFVRTLGSESVLFADDAEVTKAEADKLDEESVKTLINAQAFNYRSGEKIDNSKISINMDKFKDELSKADVKSTAGNIAVSLDDGTGRISSTTATLSIKLDGNTTPPGPGGTGDPVDPKDPDLKDSEKSGGNEDLPKTGSDLLLPSLIFISVAGLGTGIYIKKRFN